MGGRLPLCLQDRKKVKQLQPGAYVCAAGDLHIFAKELCEWAGVPPIQHNIEMLEAAVREMLPETAISIIE